MKSQTNLVWRLTKLPTAEELKTLVDAKILTPEEVKQMLVRVEDVDEEEKKIDRDELKELKEEMAVLRKLVLEISARTPSTITIIEREIERWKPWRYPQPWWTEPYYHLCSSLSDDKSSIGLPSGKSLSMQSVSFDSKNIS